ncbi:putative membrane protein [Synechococcus sp. MVIR-18-1]|nr:putative membrane protein [Synechococcus sp. MVIR-18-1]
MQSLGMRRYEGGLGRPLFSFLFFSFLFFLGFVLIVMH